MDIKMRMSYLMSSKVLTGNIPPSSPAATSTQHHPHLHHHQHHPHHQHPLSMINDGGLQHPSTTSSGGGGGGGGLPGHNINSIMTPPDAHLNNPTSLPYSNSVDKFSLVSQSTKRSSIEP